MNFAGYGWMAASIVSTALYFVLTSAFMRKYPRVSIHAVMAVTHGMAALMLLAFVQQPEAQAAGSSLWRNLVLVALLTWVAKIFYFYAYRRTDIAKVTVFSALTPLYAALLAPVMGYDFSGYQMLGVVIITGSVFAFYARDIVRNGAWVWAVPSAAVVCAFLSTIPTAASGYFQKDAILLSSPLYVGFFICAFSSLASFCYVVVVMPGFGKAAIRDATRLRVLKPLVVIALLQGIAALAFSAFMVHGHPAVGQALQRLSSLLQILLAHMFLGQRLNTRWHMLCVGISLVGVYVLTLQ